MDKDLTGKWCVVMPPTSEAFLGIVSSDHENGVVCVDNFGDLELWATAYLESFDTIKQAEIFLQENWNA